MVCEKGILKSFGLCKLLLASLRLSMRHEETCLETVPCLVHVGRKGHLDVQRCCAEVVTNNKQKHCFS
jgi:hypothetical protein